jgi:hypothetical protein
MRCAGRCAYRSSCAKALEAYVKFPLSVSVFLNVYGNAIVSFESQYAPATNIVRGVKFNSPTNVGINAVYIV